MIRRRAFRVSAAVAASAALACASTPASRPAAGVAARIASPAPAPSEAPPAALPVPESGGLSFSVEPGDAEVLIDGRSFGKVAELARNGTLPLQPGLYQVSLKRAGYATWRAEVAVRNGIEPIRVTLPRRPAVP